MSHPNLRWPLSPQRSVQKRITGMRLQSLIFSTSKKLEIMKLWKNVNFDSTWIVITFLCTFLAYNSSQY